MASNVQKIECFLRKLIIARGRDPLDPQDQATINLQSLMETMKEISKRIGDDKVCEVFRSILSTLALEANNIQFKDYYLGILTDFNMELNYQLN